MRPSSIALVFLLALQTGYSLKCYECNSKNDSSCANEKPPDSLKKDCAEHADGSKYVLCRKIVQTIEYEVNGLKPDTRVIRSCGWDVSSHPTSCYQRSGFGGRQEVCACNTDFCNDASAISIPLLMVPTLALLPRLL